MNPTAAAARYALTAYLRAHQALNRLTTWAQTQAEDRDTQQDGNYSTEMVVIISGIVLLALALVSIIAKKVLDKADSISF